MAEHDTSTSSDLYPSIDPSSFNLIVVGTGLPESILASAASASGKSVLHLDPNPFYGSHFSSLPISDFSSFLRCSLPFSDSLKPRTLYSHVEFSSHSPSETLHEHSRSFCLDLAGPRMLLCADPMVDLLIRSRASNYVEFKSVDASFLYSDGQLLRVPDSRQAVFMDETLKLIERTRLTMFFKLVQEHFASDGEGRRISEEDLEIPFAEFLQKQNLSRKIKEMFLYAIAMADYDQDSPEICKKIIKTKDGMETLSLYNKSVGRFPSASGAFIYPIHGQGELPQAFCRCAAVKGALYVLRMPVTCLLFDEEDGHYKGVRLASGQDLFSRQLVMDPSFIAPLPYPATGSQDERLNPGDVSNASSPRKQVARRVCIIRGSIKTNLSNLLVVFPPKSLYDEQVTSVRALQLGSNVSICPSDLFVLYLSTLSGDAVEGKKSLHAAVNALCTIPDSENSENNISIGNEGVNVEPKATLLWSAMYIQELAEGSFGLVSSCPMPDGNMDYRDLLEFTRQLFNKMYPQEEFFPEKMTPENSEDDGGTLD